jgi:hypothetical protein
MLFVPAGDQSVVKACPHKPLVHYIPKPRQSLGGFEVQLNVLLVIEQARIEYNNAGRAF